MFEPGQNQPVLDRQLERGLLQDFAAMRQNENPFAPAVLLARSRLVANDRLTAAGRQHVTTPW